jgi:hypothetical protein
MVFRSIISFCHQDIQWHPFQFYFFRPRIHNAKKIPHLHLHEPPLQFAINWSWLRIFLLLPPLRLYLMILSLSPIDSFQSFWFLSFDWFLCLLQRLCFLTSGFRFCWRIFFKSWRLSVLAGQIRQDSFRFIEWVQKKSLSRMSFHIIL